jgi:hypothetical protein
MNVSMDPPTIQNVFVPTKKDLDVIDDLHLYLIDYVRMIEKKLRVLKDEVKRNSDTKTELKPQMSLLRKMRNRAYDVLDDLEFKFNSQVDDESFESSE